MLKLLLLLKLATSRLRPCKWLQFGLQTAGCGANSKTSDAAAKQVGSCSIAPDMHRSIVHRLRSSFTMLLLLLKLIMTVKWWSRGGGTQGVKTRGDELALGEDRQPQPQGMLLL